MLLCFQRCQCISEEPNTECPRIKIRHRVGRGRGGHPPPVILKLLDFEGKITILKNSKKLEDASVRLTEDSIARVRSARKELWEATKFV